MLAPFFFSAMTLRKSSPCKVNLVLNILGKRPDGFHELETLMHPVSWRDELTFERLPAGRGVEFSCSDPGLPVDENNLAHRASASFLRTAMIEDGVRIHLEKRIPAAAGLGGGSGNAAVALLGLNELFGEPLTRRQLFEAAAALGSDVPFFMQNRPALATGRGESIEPLNPFAALRGAAFLLVRPGFGVSTAWAYQALARFPEALRGQSGRAAELARLLSQDRLTEEACGCFYNSLEAPVLEKFPLLALLKKFLLNQGAAAALMSGSGSTVFAIVSGTAQARTMEIKVREKFNPVWTCVAPID
jgi:4-diphosphocytidyl-2-C-methyl-D-erythritol kinase